MCAGSFLVLVFLALWQTIALKRLQEVFSGDRFLNITLAISLSVISIVIFFFVEAEKMTGRWRDLFVFFVVIFLLRSVSIFISVFTHKEASSSEDKRCYCDGNCPDKKFVSPNFLVFARGERFAGFTIKDDKQDDTNPPKGGSGVPKK
jgi:hypothetical protein